MSSRGTRLKLALLAVPLAVGVLSLHAFGEPAGRAARAVSAGFSYPEHVYGVWRIRVRRGNDYHPFIAKTLQEFTPQLSAWAAPLGVIPPSRVDVLFLDSREDLERFWLDPAALDRDGLVDPAASLIARVSSEARSDHLDRDVRLLRRLVTILLLSPVLDPAGAPAWVKEGLASCFETVAPGAAEVPVKAAEPVPTLPELLKARPADFRGPSSSRLSEGAKLWTAFLLERKPETLMSWLRGGAGAADRFASAFGDAGALEADWKEWLRRPPK